jgi:hydroxyacylglutathione hydrolase
MDSPGTGGCRPAGGSRWRIWYDDQCEVCQAGLAWLRRLDRLGRVEAITVLEGPPPSGVDKEALLRELYLELSDGTILHGAPAVAALAGLSRWTSWIGWIARRPGLSQVAELLYQWVARHRYSLSRCRGGACSSFREDLMCQNASWRSFQLCRFFGLLLVAPLSCAAFVKNLRRQLSTWWRTRRKTANLLQGRLSIHFLGGGCSAMVPILFGELFSMVRYRSLLLDPGGSRMGRSVATHLRRLVGRPEAGVEQIREVAPTHAHEEHCGNLDLAVQITGARLHLHPRAARILKAPPRIPWMRRWVIGQPPPVTSAFKLLERTLELDLGAGSGSAGKVLLEVIETPGHCDDHLSFYAAADRLLLIGDGFMGTHFSTPNDDVDHRAWIRSLERLLELEVEIMVEAHGHVHTLRDDVLRDLEGQGLAALASRRNPRQLLEEKLEFLRWVGEQVELGRAEGLPSGAIRATVFPWTQSWSYESALQATVAAGVSLRGFGRHKVARSFRPAASGPAGGLPQVYEVRWRS